MSPELLKHFLVRSPIACKNLVWFWVSLHRGLCSEIKSLKWFHFFRWASDEVCALGLLLGDGCGCGWACCRKSTYEFLNAMRYKCWHHDSTQDLRPNWDSRFMSFISPSTPRFCLPPTLHQAPKHIYYCFARGCDTTTIEWFRNTNKQTQCLTWNVCNGHEKITWIPPPKKYETRTIRFVNGR